MASLRSAPGASLREDVSTSVRTRILVAAAVGALLCALAVAGLTLLTVGASARQRLSDLEALLGPAQLADCRAQPDRFVFDERLFRIWAYDPQGRSLNPRAPALAPSFLVGVPRGASRMDRAPGGPWWRQSAIQRVADDGPCAVLYADPPGPFPLVPYARLSTLFGTVLGLAAALMATMVLAVRPLVHRLGRLDRAAEHVGTERFASASDAGDDEIGRISATLDDAHRRIVADTEELLRRQHTLEDHLAAVAHDLRTPLASLQLLLEELSRQPARGDDTLREARLEVAYLEALADNLHQATLMSAGLAAADGEADLTELVGRIESRFAILGRLLGGTVAAARPDEPVWVRCRPALLERALANLVHNGVVHGSGDVGIVLTAGAGRFSVTVRSAGPPLDGGLVDDLAQRRLDRPADPARSRSRGRGLGIAIVNAVAHGAGFEIRYEAPDDGGLQVTLSGSTR